jgi:hypoxanthine phosphoribosyltransferase
LLLKAKHLFLCYICNLFEVEAFQDNTKQLKTVLLHNKQFELFVPAEKIMLEVERIAESVNTDLSDKTPIFIGLLNGAFMFTTDLVKRFNGKCVVSFVKLSSYVGSQSTGNVEKLIGLKENIEGRTVVVVEDVVDSGITLFHFLKEIEVLKPAELKVAAMFYKPDSCKYNIKIDYLGMSIPDEFIVGYGLDYDGLGRNYKDLYKLSK